MKNTRLMPVMPKIAILGGDNREMMVAAALANKGWQVFVYGREPQALPAKAIYCTRTDAALKDALAIILPVPPLRDGPRLHNAEGLELTVDAADFGLAKKNALCLSGVISPYLQQISLTHNLHLIETLDIEEIAQPFAKATAEGALSLALNANQDILYRKKALIIGYGRIGKALASRLQGLDMQIYIANRNQLRLSEAEADGFTTLSWPSWIKESINCDYIFNTAPYLLLDAQVLPQLKQNVTIIDLAANPGGTDFALASKLGINAILAAGLPGKHCPLFAGKILAEIYPKIIIDHLNTYNLIGGNNYDRIND